MRMCKHHDIDRDGMFCAVGKYRKGCPKNTNSKCQIIPAKPKVRRIKGWINIAQSKAAKRGIDANFHHRVYNDKRGAVTEAYGVYTTVPCTILIDEKYLKGEK